jgi:hypothetical protein
MKPWQHVLRDEPVVPLAADESAAIRRAVLIEARSANAVGSVTRLVPVFALGSALMVAVVAGLLVAKAHPDVSAGPPAPATGDVRQLQFATPGGTRIIWQFNPEFTLRETHP